jgi:hypothetical protein
MDIIRRNWLNIVLLLAFAIGIYLHFRNLDGVIYVDEDETRAFAFLCSGPLLCLICRPFYLIAGRNITTTFYVAAFMGLLCVVAFYIICRLIFDKKISVYAALIYGAYPFHINFARTLYPQVFIEFFFLLALLCTFLGILRKIPLLMLITGIYGACLFLIHPSTYAAIFGISAIPLLSALLKKDRIRFKDVAPYYRNLIIGAVFGCLFFQVFLFKIAGGYDALKNFLAFSRLQRMYVESKLDYGGGFVHVAEKMFRSIPVIVINVFTGISCLAVTIGAVIKKKHNLSLFCIPYIAGASLVIILAIVGLHVLVERSFVWLSSFFSLSLAYFFIYIIKRQEAVKRFAVAGTAFVLFGVMVFESYQITQETFKITDIYYWLRKRNVPVSKVVTQWWQLGLLEGEAPWGVPTVYDKTGREHYLWFLDSPKPMIIWNLIFKIYTAGAAKYIITSGPSLNSYTGEGELILENIAPRVSWPHPYTSMTHRPWYTPQLKKLFIKIYDLYDVFSEDNWGFVQKRRAGAL